MSLEALDFFVKFVSIVGIIGALIVIYREGLSKRLWKQTHMRSTNQIDHYSKHESLENHDNRAFLTDLILDTKGQKRSNGRLIVVNERYTTARYLATRSYERIPERTILSRFASGR